MNRRGIRLVAAQLVIVGVLLLVVYLTLLQPEEHKPLFGVGVPAGPGQVAQAPGGGPAGSSGGVRGAGEERGGSGNRRGHGAGHHRGAGHRGAPGGRGRGSATAYSGSEAAEAAQAPALPVPTRDGGEGGVTPTGDQYDDTVSRLFGNL
jgi:hypothetical protein